MLGRLPSRSGACCERRAAILDSRERQLLGSLPWNVKSGSSLLTATSQESVSAAHLAVISPCVPTEICWGPWSDNKGRGGDIFRQRGSITQYTVCIYIRLRNERGKMHLSVTVKTTRSKHWCCRVSSTSKFNIYIHAPVNNSEKRFFFYISNEFRKWTEIAIASELLCFWLLFGSARVSKLHTVAHPSVVNNKQCSHQYPPPPLVILLKLGQNETIRTVGAPSPFQRGWITIE